MWRSLRFSQALAQGEWADTAQIGHPGVTTMWLGSLGILVKRAADPVASTEAIQWLGQVTTLAPENAEAFKRLGVFLTYARLPVILINALGVVLIYLLVRRLWGQRVGVIAGLLFALDPFTAGLSGLLHVDGLLTTFSVLCVLAMLNGVVKPPSPALPAARQRGAGVQNLKIQNGLVRPRRRFCRAGFPQQIAGNFPDGLCRGRSRCWPSSPDALSFKHALLGFVVICHCSLGYCSLRSIPPCGCSRSRRWAASSGWRRF